MARLLSFAKAIYNNLDHKPIHILEKGLVTGAVTEGGCKGFPLAIMNMTPGRRIEAKELLRYSISHLLIHCPPKLIFSSACQGPFMPSKAKNMCQRLRNLGAKFSETSFPHFKTYFTQINHCYHLRQQFNRFDSNNFTLSSMISFQNAWPIKRKAVYTLLCLL